MKTSDFLVIGAGISGASVAYELASYGSVVVLEAESFPGYHSTGRSAALYTPNYGPALVRKICRLSYDFLSQPSDEFTTQPLLKPRGMLSVALSGHANEFSELTTGDGPEIEAVSAEQILHFAPFLRRECIVAGTYEKGVEDIDVHALHQGFLKGMQRKGGQLIVNAKVGAISREASSWIVSTDGENYQAEIIINAAGAWADQIGQLAGLKSIGLDARRRSAILVDGPAAVALSGVPAIDFIGMSNYIKPETTQLMVSPGDEFSVLPQDVQVDDYDIAVLVDWLETNTRIRVEKIKHQWAGLRTFVPDGLPVVGFDSNAHGFFWLAGQGGYGIMMAHPLSRASASLIVNKELPDDFVAANFQLDHIAPDRLAVALG